MLLLNLNHYKAFHSLDVFQNEWLWNGCDSLHCFYYSFPVNVWVYSIPCHSLSFTSNPFTSSAWMNRIEWQSNGNEIMARSSFIPAFLFFSVSQNQTCTVMLVMRIRLLVYSLTVFRGICEPWNFYGSHNFFQI